MEKQIKREGLFLPFTCSNTGFKTDIAKGFAHIAGHDYFGSVLPHPLYEDEQSKMYLEHVVSSNGDSSYWIMWYNSAGTPLIRASGVFGNEELTKMLKHTIIEAEKLPSQIIKEINKPTEILANTNSHFFNIVLQLNDGNVGMWNGNGFDYISDGFNPMPKMMKREEIEREYAKALDTANIFAKQFGQTGLLAVTNLPVFGE